MVSDCKFGAWHHRRLLLLAGAFFLIVVSGHDGGYSGYNGRLNKKRKLIWGVAGVGLPLPSRFDVGGVRQTFICAALP
jgi:hypothetical protein